MRFFINLSQMRCSVRCKQCEEIINVGWVVCPQCQSQFKDQTNLTLDVLSDNILGDMAEYLKRDSFYQGKEFIRAASEKCLFDWEWGHNLGWAEGHFLLAKCYADYDCHAERIPDTTGPEQSEICEAMAVNLYRLAALKGLPPAEDNYGYCLLQGRGGLTKKPTEGFQFVQRAAEHGYLQAKYNLSSLYRYGHGVLIDEAKAQQLHVEAAEAGFAPAQVALASNYWHGTDGFPRDLSLALKWYRKAAEQGYADAIFYVGFFYYDGIGIPKNKPESRKWFVEAAKQNHLDALRLLKHEDGKFFSWR
jgi:TPR repeat protein